MPIVESTSAKGVEEQTRERLDALYRYYQVDASAPDGPEQLIQLLAAEKFPSAFKIVPGWQHRTNKTKWGWTEKTHLLEFMERAQEEGFTQKDAAKDYIRQFLPDRSTEGLLAEYHRAKQWKRGDIPWTEAEYRELHDYALEWYGQIARGK